MLAHRGNLDVSLFVIRNWLLVFYIKERNHISPRAEIGFSFRLTNNRQLITSIAFMAQFGLYNPRQYGTTKNYRYDAVKSVGLIR